MSTRVKDQGFTILELLISLTLLGGIGVVMFGGLWYGLQTWHRATVFTERADDLTTVRESLTQILGHAYPLYLAPTPPRSSATPAAVPGGHGSVDFTGIAAASSNGDGSAIRFLAPTPQSLGGGGLTRFELAVVPDIVGVSLVMRAQPELTNNPGDWIVSTIIEHAKEIDFSYYNSDVESVESPKWLKHWGHQTTLPKLVRISIQFPGLKWPEVMIEPRIAIDASCTYDPIAMTCSGR